MKRTAITWAAFSAAVVLVLAVMLFFTVRMLQFERAVAQADIRATVEENIRLALWRMDSTATALLAPKGNRGAIAKAGNRLNKQQDNNFEQQVQRNDIAYQNMRSIEELQQRQSVNPTESGDWCRIEPQLLERISDLLPGARLEAIGKEQAKTDDPRRLASIPARLVVPPAAFIPPAIPWNTPLRISLMIAWACALVAAIAVAMLLRGALSLSERRGAFVSAVTHELRTPLTTFRMYAEMLATGMVGEAPDRQQYLDTLVTESDRLGQLIENVLAYARLERQISPGRAKPATVAELIERVMPALRRRTEQSKLRLDAAVSEEAAVLSVAVDAIAVQQILLNLVDNACKYAGTPISIVVSATPRQIEIRVSDQGRGLDENAAAKLFQAFSKSRDDTIPGIGLGLHLSRRLARDLGGDLRLVPTEKGACFVVTLDRAANI